MILFFGNVGSGKGTQAKLLAERLNYPTISTGQLLRSSSDPKIKAVLDSGKLVNNEILCPLLEKELKRIRADKNEFILDGFPRRVNQAKWLVDKIRRGELKFSVALCLNLTEETALERLKLRGRHDDTPIGIRQRFAEYETSVVPTIEYLQSQGFKVIEIDGNRSIEKVSASIQKAFLVK